MRRARPILVVVIALSMAGCILRGKPAATAPAAVKPVAAPPVSPPAPPPPLSTPQTNVRLPAYQPVTEDALATTQPPEEGPPPAPAPLQPEKSKRPAAQSAAPRPEPAGPPAPPVEPGRALIQDVVPAEEEKRLRDEAAGFRRETDKLVSQVKGAPSGPQKSLIDSIQSFVKLSRDAEGGGDLRKAHELALRALALAKGLQ